MDEAKGLRSQYYDWLVAHAQHPKSDEFYQQHLETILLVNAAISKVEMLRPIFQKAQQEALDRAAELLAMNGQIYRRFVTTLDQDDP